MSTTGVSAYEDDQALDWSVELINAPPRFVEKTLANCDPESQSDEAECRALAAAEVIAAWRGHPHSMLPADVQYWVGERRRPPSPEVAALAVKTIRNLMAGSVVRSEMEANGLLPEWLQYTDDLVTRLQSTPAAPAMPKRKRVRVRPGLVVQFELPGNRFAYGRISGSALTVYQTTSAEPASPPIGSREFLFAVPFSVGYIRDGSLKVVGEDRFQPDEDAAGPFHYIETGNLEFTLVRHPVSRRATATECRGLEQYAVWGPEEVVDRILYGNQSAHTRRFWPLLRSKDGSIREMSWSEWDGTE